MAAIRQSQDRLLSEHFGFHPITLLDDIVNMVNELVNQAVDGAEATLKGNNIEHLGFSAENNSEALVRTGKNLDEIAELEIEEGVHKLESLLNSTVDRSLDIMELFVMRNFLSVSNVEGEEDLQSWVRLDHYKDLDLSSDNDEAPSVDLNNLVTLRRKVQETQKLQLLLKAEAARNEAILDRLRMLAGVSRPNTEQGSQQPNLSFLTQTRSDGDHDEATTQLGRQLMVSQHMQYLLPRVESITASLSQARPYLSAMPDAVVTDAERVREEYLATQSAKAMAKVGITANEKSINSGSGRPLNEEEVQALESVATELRNK